jgi:hypothetical protein
MGHRLWLVIQYYQLLEDIISNFITRSISFAPKTPSNTERDLLRTETTRDHMRPQGCGHKRSPILDVIRFKETSIRKQLAFI